MIAVREFSSAAEMQTHYRALRARTFPAPRPEASAPAVEAAPEPPAFEIPEAFAEKLDTVFPTGMSEARRIVAVIASRYELTAEDIYRPCMNASNVAARWEAMAAVSRANPNWSLPKLGKFFRRDHTTILHALRKTGVR